MTEIARGNPSIGLTNLSLPTTALPTYAENPETVLQYLMSQMGQLRTLVEGKADSTRLKTLIRYSDEQIYLQASEIALVGNVTFLDVWRDQTGQVTGALHPSFTRIRGGVIQTGVILSSNWGASTGSAFDLDNGTFALGGAIAPKLSWDGTNLTINGSGTFSGSLSAASGTFAGALVAATGTFSGSLSAATGTFSGNLTTSGQVIATGQNTLGGIVAAIHAVPTAGGCGLYANSGTSTSPTIQADHTGAFGIAVLAQASTGSGVFASASGSGGTALRATVTGAATVAFKVDAGNIDLGTGKLLKSHVNGDLISIFDPVTHNFIASYEWSTS